MPLVTLASASPRRRELLRILLADFHVAPSSFDESAFSPDGKSPENLVVLLALGKARAVHKEIGGVVIGADTVVSLGRRILGKPRDVEEAREMLRVLRMDKHQVVTGLAVIDDSGKTQSECLGTVVTFRQYTDDEIETYLATGDSLDKAGAYAIQHPGFHPASRIDGCYYNVMGLPLCKLAHMLRQAGVQLDLKKTADLPQECLVPVMDCPLAVLHN